MAIAETAKLAVELSLKDNLSGGLARAKDALGNFGDAARLSVGRANDAIGNFGDSIRSKIGGAVDGVRRKFAGMFSEIKRGVAIGIGFGITNVVAQATGAVVGFFTESGAAAETFGTAALNASKLLNTSIEEASAVTDVLEKFKIPAEDQLRLLGMLERNAGKYGATAKSAAAFQEKFGVNLLNSNGKLKSGVELLKDSADVWNSNATSAQKAQYMQALYGRGWEKFIPLFNIGRKAFEEQMDSAIKLTKEDLKNLDALKLANADVADSFGDLQVKIGLKLAPMIAGAFRGIADFVDKNGDKIVGFVGDAAKFAGTVADAIMGLAPIGKAIADAWNAIPDDFKKLIIGGVVANKALKMTIGVDVIDMIKKQVFKSIGIAAGVVNVSGKVVNAGGVGGTGGPGGGGFLANVLKWAGAIGLAIVATELFDDALRKGADNIKLATELPDKAKDFVETATEDQVKIGQLAVEKAKADLGLMGVFRDALGVIPATGPAIQGLFDAATGFKAATTSLNTTSTILRDAAVNLGKDITIQVSGVPGAKPQTVHVPGVQPTATPFIQPGYKKVGGRASGGPVSAGEMYIVGERRPEIFVPRTSGHVYPSAVPNVNVNVSTSARQNEQGRTIQFRYGPVPATAGAS